MKTAVVQEAERLQVAPKRLNVFERYLSVWVALCMIAGVGLGKLAPGLMTALRGLEFATGSQINIPIAVPDLADDHADDGES